MDSEKEHVLECCRKRGLRITVGLKSVIDALLKARLPQSLHDLETHQELMDVCDRTTIFRTLQRLEGIGLLRRLNFAHKGAKFTLNTGAQHREYLICSECGEVRELEMSCPVHALEKTIATETGYAAIAHELTFYGRCQACA